jgi:DNA-directed RNA polymerase specialized sigma24 family protein
MSDDGERRLAERCASREPAAWREFVRLHDTVVILVLARLLGTGAASELQDLRQDVYFRLLRDSGAALLAFRADRPGALRRYIARVAFGVGLDHLRSRRRGLAMAGALEALDPFRVPAVSPEDASVKREEHAAFSRALLRLADGPQRDRDLIILRAHFSEGRSPGEIERMGVGLTEKGIDTFLRRASERLRADLEEHRDRSLPLDPSTPKKV